MRKLIIIIGIMFTVLHFGVLNVSAETFALDPNYSAVLHKIKHLMGYNVGTFEDVTGTITLDDENKKIEQISAEISIASINTRNQIRDTDLRSVRFFDVQSFPKATFQSTKVTKNKIFGNLTLKGITKKITLSYNWAGVGKDQYGNTKMALSANGIIDRTTFGVSHNEKTKDNKWLLGDEVELIIEVQGKREG